MAFLTLQKRREEVLKFQSSKPPVPGLGKSGKFRHCGRILAPAEILDCGHAFANLSTPRCRHPLLSNLRYRRYERHAQYRIRYAGMLNSFGERVR